MRLKMSSKKPVNPYPSSFGSHKSMVNEKESEELIPYGWVVCEDENGPYATQVEKLDSGLADPNRYYSKRLRILREKRKEDK